MAQDPAQTVAFFDLDDTLYDPEHCKLMQAMIAFLEEQMAFQFEGLAPGDIEQMQRRYWSSPNPFVELARDGYNMEEVTENLRTRLEPILPRPDPQITQLLYWLRATSVRLWVITNGSSAHAEYVLKSLAVRHLFDGITACNYDFDSVGQPICKPNRSMYDKAAQEAKCGPFDKCCLVDDSQKNCIAAVEFGWKAMWWNRSTLSLTCETPPNVVIVDNIKQLKLELTRFIDDN